MSKIKNANWDEIESGELDLATDQPRDRVKPTYNQTNCIYKWLSWKMPTAKAMAAANYLERTASRMEVSQEMNRLKKLKDARRLDEETAFSSKIWEGFDERLV